MPSERLQRRIAELLDEADAAMTVGDWATVQTRAQGVLAADPEHGDGKDYLAMAQRGLAAAGLANARSSDGASMPSAHMPPASFVSGRYSVRRFLGEGGRKRVYLAHDSRLDREVAFCAIRTAGLDLVGHERVRREAQAMGRLGGHPNLVPIYDIGDDHGTPYIVEEFMRGGDVAALLAAAEEHRPPLERTLAVAKDICRALAFVHAGGFVHRDIKPANVFLAEDGTAKIGDFGLAVALDRSRLTQHGLMLGTVAYMPPEQALGGESTPKADLYSLGALLYEMVTGRPPFVGDDPTAVISQHINTPPVAPSWVTEHCPPALEEIILALLAKVPADRPQSATAALAALEAVDPAQRSANHSNSNELSRLARGVFVGRGPELEKLRKAFDGAFAGRGNLVMLVGEPGIGKTRAAQELETYARMRGATVLWGRAHESSGAPAYWPWIQAGRQWASLNDLASIQLELEQTQGELSRLFPELRNLPRFMEPEPLTDPQSAQFRLFDAYATLVRAMAGRSPLVIVLDDLHWSDKPTLLLLQHLARELANLRVLVVGTFRDTDLNRTHPLSEALASLNRETGFERVVLKGLSRADVTAYIRETANVDAQPALVDRIYEETEGNPFFLSEVVNLLTQEGSFAKESMSDIAVPDGVKEALGRRLDRISAETNELLQVCAVAGREFSYDTLTLLGDRDEEQLLKDIEEALAARVIEEMGQAGRYRFTHALMQETLLAELSTTRRVRLHGQVGEALEKRWGDRADDFASRLAFHFAEAATLAPFFREKAMHYGVVAARQALAQSAFPEAARLFRSVLAMAEGRQVDDELAEIFTDYASAAYAIADRNEGWRASRTAFEHWYRTGDVGMAVKIALLPAPRVGRAELLRRALTLVPEGSLDYGFLHAALGETIGVTDADDAAAQEAFQVARAVAVRLGLKHLELKVLLAEATVDFHHFRPGEWFRKSEMAATLAKELDEPLLEEKAHNLAAMNCDLSLRDVAREHAFAARALAERSRDWAVILGATNCQSVVAQLAGDWETVREAVKRALGIENNSVNHLGHLAEIEVQTGHFDAARDALSRIDANRVRGANEVWELSIGMHAYVTGAATAYATIDDVVTIATPGSRTTPLVESLALIGRGISASLTSDRAAAEDLLQRLERFAGWWILGLTIDHVRGLLLETLDQPDRAIETIETTLGYPQSGYGFRPYWSWAAFDCARIRLARAGPGDRERARDLIAQALGHAQDLGMQPLLGRLLGLKLLDQGISGSADTSIEAVNAAVQGERPTTWQQVAPDGTVTLLFSDIEDSTPLNERLGDVRWLEVLRLHNALIEREVRSHRGFVVKTMGDGFMVAFQAAADGLRCAIAIQAAAMSLPEGVRVRIGLHSGDVTRDGDDFFGRHVNLAARVAGLATGGQVLASGVVHELVAGQGFDFDEGSDVELKGFNGTHRVYRATSRRATD